MIIFPLPENLITDKPLKTPKFHFCSLVATNSKRTLKLHEILKEFHITFEIRILLLTFFKTIGSRITILELIPNAVIILRQL